MNSLKRIIEGKDEDVEIILQNTLDSIYKDGPVSIVDMETLSYISLSHQTTFNKYKDSLLSYLGLFYKHPETNSLKDLVFRQYGNYIQEQYKVQYTPVQANIASQINNYKCFSFSAPTSTGKSYVFLQEIKKSQKDVVIVVPSRALLNEYYINLCNEISDKRVNILKFIDKINTKIAIKNVFVVTPERCRELFRQSCKFDIELFLFDEAQLSDEPSKRGLYYDSIVRRCQKAFPRAKFIFAYPFVTNPSAQIEKNHFNTQTATSMTYAQKSVGQIFMQLDQDGTFYHFSIDPAQKNSHRIKSTFDPIERTILEGGSVLFFISKSKILNKSFQTEFSKYISLCEDINNPLVDKYIKRLMAFAGGQPEINKNYFSQLVAFLKKGIVIHHGSLPLEMRTIVENYTKENFCKICFATTTLEQGINMPFDLVFIDRMDYQHPLAIKNLIGRAGRSTLENRFDVGYVVLNSGQIVSRFRKVITGDIQIDNVSMLEKEDDNQLGTDYIDFKESILNGTFSDEYNLTPRELDSLQESDSNVVIEKLLNELFPNDLFITPKYIKENPSVGNEIIDSFVKLYELFLHREVKPAELNVLKTAVRIMLNRILGITFKHICMMRYSMASRLALRQQRIKQKLPVDSIHAQYMTGYHDLPDYNLPQYSLFPIGTMAKDVDYDLIVCDTYDFIDKLIGLKLSDIYYAAFYKYYERTKNLLALRLSKFMRYGTDNERYIWMVRYGMSFEDIQILDQHIKSIDESQIVFKDSISNLDDLDLLSVKRFLP